MATASGPILLLFFFFFLLVVVPLAMLRFDDFAIVGFGFERQAAGEEEGILSVLVGNNWTR